MSESAYTNMTNITYGPKKNNIIGSRTIADVDAQNPHLRSISLKAHID